MHEGCIRRYPREVGGTTPVAYEDLGRPSNRLAAALAEVLLLEGVHGIVLGRQDSMGVGPRACALVGPFAYREVLADDEKRALFVSRIAYIAQSASAGSGVTSKPHTVP